jgi:hypothetical protein
MTSQSSVTRIKLSWKRIECRRCHEARVVGIPCPMCNARPDPREVDPNLQRRQRLARDALTILDRPPGTQTTSRPVLDQWSPDQGFGHLAEWLEQFLPALNAAIDDAAAAPRLFELVATLVDLRDEVRASQWLRPHLPLWRTADTLIGRLTDVARHYLLACAAPTPLQAQAAAGAGQQALDTGADDSDYVGDIIAALASRPTSWREPATSSSWRKPAPRTSSNSSVRHAQAAWGSCCCSCRCKQRSSSTTSVSASSPATPMHC